MAAKTKSPRKRGQECLEMNEKDDDQEPPIIIANIKRRKKAKDGVSIAEESKSPSIESTGGPVTNTRTHTTMTSIVTLRKDTNSDSCWEHSISTCSEFSSPSPDREQNLASHVKKTYASGSKCIPVKKDRGRLKGNDTHRSSVLDHLHKEDRCESGIEQDKLKVNNVKKDGTNDTSRGQHSPLEVKLAHDMKDNTLSRCDMIEKDNSHDKVHHNENDQSQMVNKDTDSKNENNSTVYVTSNSCSENNRAIGNVAKISSKVAIGESSQPIESKITRDNHSLLSSISSNIQMSHGHHTLPHVLRSVSGSGIPLTSVSANALAITAIPTPIATFPMLPNMTKDVCGETVYAVGFTNSVTKQESHYSGDVSAANGFAYSIDNSVNKMVSDPKSSAFAVDRNSLQANTFSTNAGDIGDHKNIKVSAQGSHLEHHTEKSTASVPIVDIEDEKDSLLIESCNISVSSVNCTPATSMAAKETVSTSNTAGGSEGNHSTHYLQIVDNWGAYLLQRLELLYEHEQECDLVLRFSGGETLKVHRAIMLACTSLVSNTNSMEQEKEFCVPSDLHYTSVEPVIRFVYSGRLDVRGSHTEISAIYAAALRLQVSLLTRLMDQHFPYLSSPPLVNTRLPVWRRCPEKIVRHNKQRSGKSNSKTQSSRALSPSNTSFSGCRRSVTCGETSKTLGDGEGVNTKDTAEDSSIITIKEEDQDEGQDGSVYFLMTNSQKIAQANAAERRKRPAEEARPTRFELEEDTENPSVQISTWSSKSSSLSPLLTATSAQSHNDSNSSCSSLLSSAVAVSPNSLGVHFSSSSPLSSMTSNICKRSLTYKHGVQPQDPFSLLTQDVPENQSLASRAEEEVASNAEDSSLLNTKAFKEQEVTIQDQNDIGEDDIGKDGDELMEKISSICKQLEEKDLDEKESNREEVYVASDHKMEVADCETSSTDECSRLLHVTEGENSSDSRNSLAMNTSAPVKSILKKKKDKSDTNKLKKHVSFPLDENDELINEVATYSHAKEPAQSLIEVQKRVGSFKSSGDSYSPVKLTLSLKKKVLVNLSLGDSEASESPSHENEKGKDKKEDSFACQSTSQGQLSKGDMSNHAKIISEVLKKYPHLVKDKKNIRLKILKKGSDKAGSGKLVKSKVQYLVLSENESKVKTCIKSSKTSANSGTKGDSNTSLRAIQNTKTFECPECEDLVFSSYFTFKKHVSAEHKEKSSTILASIENVPYACYTCFINEPLEFSDYCSYQQHMKDVHSKSEARLCSTCGFRPGRKLELAYHQYIEHNKVPRNVTFPKCDLCDHVAMNDAALLKHRSQHANADNYTCSVCGVVFCSFGALQGHMRTKLCQNKRSISHKCPHCPLTFARSYNLKAHCKSSHRAIQTTVQIAPGSAQKQPDFKHQDEMPIGSGETAKSTETNSSSCSEQGELDVEEMCESLNSMGGQSSSEAEALSTVANSLAASLGLPEETVNHYMYSQGNLDGGKYEEGIARPGGVNVQLVDATTSGSGYQGELPICHDRTFTSQAPMSNTSNVGALYPVSVVPSQLMSNQLVPGQILPSQILQGGGSVLGAAPHSWTYVTYQVPTTTNDLPAVIAETTTLNAATITPEQRAATVTSHHGSVSVASDQGSRVDAVLTGKPSGNSIDTLSDCEQQNPLVVMANTATQVNNSQASHLPVTHSYDAFPSQFV